jgi:hypothetical protein
MVKIPSILLWIALFILTNSCLDPYNPSISQNNSNLLVVDSFLNGTDSTCYVILTRTIPLATENQEPIELNAIVTLEQKDGGTFTLSETGGGTYKISHLPIVFNAAYRLKIITKNNSLYTSDFIPLKDVPPIDKVTWGYERNGVALYVDSHDDTNSTRYYRWKFTETWMYNSAFYSYLKEENGRIVSRPSSEQIYYCWRSTRSTQIIVSSSSLLNNDNIDNALLSVIGWDSPKLDKKYSVLVEQTALTKEGYDYLSQLKKNTENLGTLFDPLPTRLTGNIKCITNTEEKVLGYFMASSVAKKRIFISNRDINKPIGVTGYETCMLGSVGLGDNLFGAIPISYLYQGPAVVGYVVASASCADCRANGGVSQEPDFWE